MLENLKQAAINSYHGISFSPERRGESLINDMEDALKNDLETIKEASEEQKQKYTEKFKSLLSAWISAKSRCLSPMITGPANFPVRRNEKANRSEQNKGEIFYYWREKAKKGILKSLQPEKTFQTEIKRYKSELESMQANHVKMKEGNRRIKEAHKTGEDLTKYLTDVFGIAPHMIDWTMKFGFGLTNNNANMKRVEGRIKELEAKAKRAEGENKEVIFNGGKLIFAFDIDRLQIQYESKPERETINLLKHSGFHWSPACHVWQRQISREAIWKSNQITGLSL